jgi:nuclease S1
MPGRSPHRSSFAFALTVLVALQSTSPAFAWGRLGHRVISRLAEKQLTPAAKAAITELLEPGESLADASLWADENRGRLPKTAPWHYVDVPLNEPRYDAKFAGDVSTTGRVVDKINEFRLVVKDKSKSVEDRRFALRFRFHCVHCVEDVHQPCQVWDNHDKGGEPDAVQQNVWVHGQPALR